MISFNISVANFLNPPILFFLLGALASLLRVDLSIPHPVLKFISMYLLLSIGFSGGVELSHTADLTSMILPVGLALLASIVIPIYTFFILKTRLSVYDSAAIAASYGSVSAVTFITAIDFLSRVQIPFDGFMTAMMALMESPAIVIGLLLAGWFGGKQVEQSTRSLLEETVLNSSVFLILGSLVIGYLSSTQGLLAIKPFTKDIFKGMLCLFMLDMGVLAAKRLSDIKRAGLFLIPFGMVMPVVNACLAIAISWMLGFSAGNTLLTAILFASASYIAVPAAMRLALPQANPGIYIPVALGVTFPFNILIGLPLYFKIISYFWGI